MPGISSFTPAWLSRPSPGFTFFNRGSCSNSTSGRDKSSNVPGPDRTIASRGTEVFLAVDNEIRWTDLVLLRDKWEDAGGARKGSVTSPQDKSDDDIAYRILKVPVFGKIRQLLISPFGEYIAILTTHTVHIAILPDSSHLTPGDRSPLKLKAFQVGPSSHVVDESPVASALWHPLGVQGNCLVTITLDAVARVWELDRDNRWSFNEPTLAVDMKKLANASSSTEGFSPSKYGANKGFSADSFEMEVASACFGGTGAENEVGWSSMTLWIAMQEGDIYALCPFLPSKWQPHSTLIPKLSSTILARSAAAEENSGKANPSSTFECRISSAQYAWMSELDHQIEASNAAVHDSMIYQRPTRPGPVPKMQGPFSFGTDMDEIFEISDIFVIPAIEEAEDFEEEDFAANAEHAALSVSVICVATSDNQVHVCLDVEGTEGRWLPTHKVDAATLSEERSFPELLLVKSISLGPAGLNGWTTFTADEQSRYSLLITHENGVARLSFSDWANKLEEELAGTYDTGAEFRVELLVESARFDLEEVVEINKALSTSDAPSRSIAACLNLQDSDLGNFLLTVADRQPHAATLETSSLQLLLEGDAGDDMDDDEVSYVVGNESRPAYQPPQEFWNESVLKATVDEHITGRSRQVLQEKVRLSPLTLKIVMDAHRVLSHETHRLGLAAADLFRRCERLQEEFKEQINRANQAASRVDSLLDDEDAAEVFSQTDEQDDEEAGLTASIEKRLRIARTQQEALIERCTAIREKVGRLDKHPLSEKEAAWVAEIKSMEGLVYGSDKEAGPPCGSRSSGEEALQQPAAPWQRIAEVERLAEELKARVDELRQGEMEVTQDDGGDAEDAEGDASYLSGSTLSSAGSQRRLGQIFAMLERESALVEGTSSKLARLSVMTRM